MVNDVLCVLLQDLHVEEEEPSAVVILSATIDQPAVFDSDPVTLWDIASEIFSDVLPDSDADCEIELLEESVELMPTVVLVPIVSVADSSTDCSEDMFNEVPASKLVDAYAPVGGLNPASPPADAYVPTSSLALIFVPSVNATLPDTELDSSTVREPPVDVVESTDVLQLVVAELPALMVCPDESVEPTVLLIV